MVLKHTPLGEINLPFVASSANAPRCRRNRRSFRIGVATNAIIPRWPPNLGGQSLKETDETDDTDFMHR